MSLSRTLIFLTIVLSLLTGLHRFLWARLIRDTGLPQPWRMLGGAVLVGLPTLVLGSFLTSRLLPSTLAFPVSWLGYAWLGTMFYLVLLLLPFEPLRLGAAIAAPLGWTVDPARRLLLSRLAAGVAGVGAFGAAGIGLWTVARGPELVRISVPIRNLDPKLAGLRIVQITDVHISPTLGADFLADIVARCNALDADIVAITGDLIDGTVDQLRASVAPLARLKSKLGTFFVTGNHEYYYDAVAWVAHLPTLGVRVLRNERVRIARDGAVFDLAGVDDWRAEGMAPGHGADLPGALRGRDPKVPVVLMAHQPKAVTEASALGVDLQLSGHTHGGQLAPLQYLVALDQPAIAGMYRFGGTALYVSRGTGYWGPPMRVGVPAEITAIELVPAV